MFSFDPDHRAPVFQQICDGVVRDIERGTLSPGAQLPTVRDMADSMGLAANTVAKAYKQLAAEGHVITRGRNGTFVAERDDGKANGSAEEARQFAASAKRAGLSLDESIGLLRRLW